MFVSANSDVRSAMNYMEAADRMGVRSHDWLVFKQVMKFLQTAGDLLNSGLQRMMGKEPHFKVLSFDRY